MEKLGVLVIRGSGGTGFARQQKFIDKVNKQLTKKGIKLHEIAYEFVDWYEPLQTQQEILLDRMFNNPEINLKSKTLRKLLMGNIADLINYGGKPNLPSQTYEKTQLLVYNAVMRLQSRIVENGPMIILASSMGTEIMNNYIWDRQHARIDDPLGTTSFERFETLVGLFTFGNNIPIFASYMKIDDLMPIQFPIPGTLPQYREVAIWENYYDKNDPLGYPIKFLNEHYANSKVVDKQVGVGNIISFWNIMSHFGYWTSRKIRNRVSDFIAKIMQTNFSENHIV